MHPPFRPTARHRTATGFGPYGTVAAAGVSALFLEVDADNDAALALYRGLGFGAVGARRGYYGANGGSGGDAVVMRRDLKDA